MRRTDCDSAAIHIIPYDCNTKLYYYNCILNCITFQVIRKTKMYLYF